MGSSSDVGSSPPARSLGGLFTVMIELESILVTLYIYIISRLFPSKPDKPLQGNIRTPWAFSISTFSEPPGVGSSTNIRWQVPQSPVPMRVTENLEDFGLGSSENTPNASHTTDVTTPRHAAPLPPHRFHRSAGCEFRPFGAIAAKRIGRSEAQEGERGQL